MPFTCNPNNKVFLTLPSKIIIQQEDEKASEIFDFEKNLLIARFLNKNNTTRKFLKKNFPN